MPEDGIAFELWRLDDNGQKFLVGRFSSRRGAERRLAEMTRVVHKQLYWIEESPAPAADGQG